MLPEYIQAENYEQRKIFSLQHSQASLKNEGTNQVCFYKVAMEISNSTNSLVRTSVIKTEVVDYQDSDVDFEYITIKKEPNEGCFIIQADSTPIVEEKVFAGFPDTHSKTDTNKRKLSLPVVNPGFCSLCNSAFPSRDDYERHQNTAHSVQRPYQCRFCNKGFKESHQRKVHETIHDASRYSGPAQFKCDLCDKSYHLKVGLDSHRRSIHQGYKHRRTGSCVIKQHHSTKGVRNHNLKIQRPKQGPQPCPHCEKVMPNKSSLKKHLTKHSDEREFACKLCGMGFKAASNLRKHERFHELGLTPRPRVHRPRGEPRICSKCGKSYKTSGELLKHMRIHTGELPYKCADCGKAFRLSQARDYHVREYHLPPDQTGLRSYSCRICGRSAINGVMKLVRHLQVSHKVVLSGGTEMFKPFACGVCGKPHHLGINAVICALLCHDPSNILEKMFRYKCPQCPDLFGFCDRFNFRKHWESCHSDLPVPGSFKSLFERNKRISELPIATHDRKTAFELRNGVDIPQEVKDSVFPLFVKRPLLEEYPGKGTTTAKHTKVKLGLSRVGRNNRYLSCNHCAMEVPRYNLQRHAKRCAQGEERQKTRHTRPRSCALKSYARKCSSGLTRQQYSTVLVSDTTSVKNS